MMRWYFLILTLALFFFHPAPAQKFEKLTGLAGYPFGVYFSEGFAERASSIAGRVERALDYHQRSLDFRPTITILVLAEADWGHHTTFPVYGMPHYDDKRKMLIVAAEDNSFWKSFLPPPEEIPTGLRKDIQKTYTSPGGRVSMQAFFDLLALHELGHAFHDQAGLTMQRKWMGELFANILLHTYIGEREPENLPALTLFPRMVIAAGTEGFTYTSLQDIEERYDEIGERHSNNYGWYQSRWHAAAAEIYDVTGKRVCRKLWDALKKQTEILNDRELVVFFKKSGAEPVANMMLNWDKDKN
ncbi:MAG TPA: hypothetical protein VFO54_09130 [Chryseosolibacter sp.]|nr:hypothetical protein [Chryseosolibacter sp.]